MLDYLYRIKKKTGQALYIFSPFPSNKSNLYYPIINLSSSYLNEFIV